MFDVADKCEAVGVRQSPKREESPLRCIVLIAACVMTLAGIAYLALRPRERGPNASQHTQPPMNWPRRRGNVCLSRICEWNKYYIFLKINDKVDPCEDFYGHVCGPKWYRSGDVYSRPFAQFSIAALMTDVTKVFKYFVTLKGHAGGYKDNFLSQMMWVYGACGKEPKAAGNVSSDFRDILSALNLSGWPFHEALGGDMVRTVATADRIMRLNVLFSVVLERRGLVGNSSLIFVLGPPKTFYKRFATNVLEATDSLYTDFVEKALNIFSSRKLLHSTAERIAALEKRLESITLVTEEEFARTRRYEVVPLRSLVVNNSWDWINYFQTLAQSDAIGSDTEVATTDPIFLKNLGFVTRSSWHSVIPNYVGFKVLMALSPFLGKEAEFLLEFTHDFDVPDLYERQVACMVLLEKLYKYGTSIVAKLTLGKEFATTPRSHLDLQLASLFDETKNILGHLVDTERSWIDASDRPTAMRKLQSMRLEFGAQSNPVDYELYRTTSTCGLRDSEAMLKSVFRIYSFSSAVYWRAWPHGARAFDSHFADSTFRVGHEYRAVSNSLFVPQASLAFMNAVSNRIYPILYAAVGLHLVRGTLEAIARTGSAIDAQLRPRAWWGVPTTAAYEQASACLAPQYLQQGAAESRLRSREEDLLDSAALEPLFQLYQGAIRDMNASDAHVVWDTTAVSMDQLFFYNHAVAFCDHRDEALWDQRRKFQLTPPRWRLNVALRNFEPFARAFHCKRGAYMNPKARCRIWKHR